MRKLGNHMDPLKHAVRYAGKIGDTLVDASVNQGVAGELALAAGEVVATRLAIGAAALLDPVNADHAEFARLVPEKAEAFSAAGTALAQRSADIAHQVTSFAVGELVLACKAAAAMADCHTPAALLFAQGRFVMGCVTRSLSQSAALAALAVNAQAAALAPVHQTATANARRLKG